MNRLSICLLLTTLLFPVLPAVHAAPPVASASNSSQSWYDIELIVFRYTDPDAGNLESWPSNPGRPDWKQATPLVTAHSVTVKTKQSGTLTPLKEIDGHQLDADWNRLEKTSGYQPLLHVAWEEPLADHSAAPTIQIGVPPPPPGSDQVPSATTMNPPAAAIKATGSGSNPVSPGTSSLATINGAGATAPTPVYGTVKFSQYGPYLHFDVDFVCQGPIAKNVMHVPAPASMSIAVPLPATDVQPPAPARQWYRMTQDRRIETGRLNYFDNPMFGVLVLVTPHPVTTTPLN